LKQFTVFECQPSKIALATVEMQSLIIEEKGQKYLDQLIYNRKQAEEERRQKDLQEQKRNRTPPKYQ
jgi:hypothetical protein